MSLRELERDIKNVKICEIFDYLDDIISDGMTLL